MNFTIDLNSILTSVSIAGIVYVAATLRSLDKQQAVETEKRARLEADYLELRNRVTANETALAALKLQLARFSAASGIELPEA